MVRTDCFPRRFFLWSLCHFALFPSLLRTGSSIRVKCGSARRDTHDARSAAFTPLQRSDLDAALYCPERPSFVTLKRDKSRAPLARVSSCAPRQIVMLATLSNERRRNLFTPAEKLSRADRLSATRQADSLRYIYAVFWKLTCGVKGV